MNSKNKNPGRQLRKLGKSLGRKSNFKEMCFELGTESILVKKTNFGYQEGVNSRVLDQ